ncbi:MAG: MFS family permease [Limisphaerales bacterium]|jgi:MFS family permease
MQSVVFAWLVTIVLREPAQLVGWAQTAILAPGMVLILLAGALADRIGADRQALAAQLVAALAPWILIAAIQSGYLSYGAMIAYALVMGTAQAFVTPARDGLLSFVAEGAIQKTILMTSLAQFSFQIVGYWLAGYADTIGPTTVLAIQSAVTIVGVLAYAMLNRLHIVKRTQHTQSVMRGVVEGAKTVMESPVMRVVVIQNIAMATFFMGCFIVCFPLVVREVFNGSSGDMAMLYAFNSLGLVVTILLQLKVGYVRQPGRALLLFQILGALVLAAAGLVDNFALFVAAVFCWGMAGGIAMPMSRTLMQELAPPEQRSRVMSFYAFSFMGAGPFGTIINGYLAASFGPQTTIVICGLAMAMVSLIIALTTRLWGTQFKPSELAT